MSTDPAATFFPDSDEIPSLYDVLGVPSTATADDLKRAYRRQSLAFHPDKASSSTTKTTTAPLSSDEATVKFQQIGFAYSVLKDPIRRARYDETGSTVEGLSADDGAKTEAEWRDYFNELWTGEVTSQSIDEFKLKYQGSEEEKQDLFDAYVASKGDLETILSTIMCSTHADEDRFVGLIDAAIAEGDLEPTTAWKRASKDQKAKEKRRKAAEKEAGEAEAYAKELGIHDKLYGGKKGGKGKGKAKGKGDDVDDEAALKALILGNRDKRMNSLMDSLEAKYGATSSSGAKKNGKKRASKGGDDDLDDENDRDRKSKKPRKVEAEPTEEEFARIQAEIDARRNSGGSKGKAKVNGAKGGRKSK
ncbi:hypothetical protein JCM10212_006916 [Sporobolomyces blumeae]